MPITFLPDRLPKAELERRHKDVAEGLRKRWTVMMENSQQTIAWVGIAKAGQGEVVFFLPHGAPESEEFCKILMRSIVRFARENSREGDAQDFESATQAALFADLATDYRDFGLFSTREKFRSRKDGKPDWARTIKSEVAFPSSSGAPVYCDIHSVRYTSKASNTVALIQARVIAELGADHLWWLKPYFGDRELPELSQLSEWPRHAWPRLLKLARRELFEDRAIRLVGMLLDYLSTTSRSGIGNTICGLSDFSSLWEVMLRETIGGVEKHWNTSLPGPFYRKPDGSRDESGRMETDIVVRHKGRLAILDAKYYKATSKGSVPGFQDIAKQLVYRMAVESTGLVNPDEVDNAFVFPSHKTCCQPYERINFFLPEGSTAVGFGTVHCQYLSVSEVAEAYAERRTLDEQNWLEKLNTNVSG